MMICGTIPYDFTLLLYVVVARVRYYLLLVSTRVGCLSPQQHKEAAGARRSRDGVSDDTRIGATKAQRLTCHEDGTTRLHGGGDRPPSNNVLPQRRLLVGLRSSLHALPTN